MVDLQNAVTIQIQHWMDVYNAARWCYENTKSPRLVLDGRNYHIWRGSPRRIANDIIRIMYAKPFVLTFLFKNEQDATLFALTFGSRDHNLNNMLKLETQ